MSDEKISSYHLIMSKTNKYLSLHKSFKTCDKFSLKIDKTKTHIFYYMRVFCRYIYTSNTLSVLQINWYMEVYSN